MKLTLIIPAVILACAPTVTASPTSYTTAFDDAATVGTEEAVEEEEEEEGDNDDVATPDSQKSIPSWLAELSNLTREQRDEYIQLFSLAKAAMAHGDWVGCETALNSCEFIFNKNPNVHNLRIVCYIEQRRLDEATEEMEKARKLLPDDATTLVNLATLHMAKKEYRACITEMTEILEDPKFSISNEVRDILTFRIFLCHLMLGEMNEAQDLVVELTPISDTPLFYCSRAAICLYLRDTAGAREDLQSAQKIFAKSGLMVPYQRALLNCDMTQAKR